MSVDVEGMDFEIIKSINLKNIVLRLSALRPLSLVKSGMEGKLPHIEEFMTLKGYMVYADTHINTIFVDRERWVNA